MKAMHFVSVPRVVAALFLFFASATLPAGEDEPVELTQFRAAYQKDVDFAARPIRERYLAKLETLKRTLGSRGDARGAVAVQDEIDKLKAAAMEALGIAKFAGTWMIKFLPDATGAEYTRRYVIKADGSMLWDQEIGKPMNRKGKIVQKGGEFFVEIENGGIERISLPGRNTLHELFRSSGDLKTGVTANRGWGTLVGPAR